MIKIDLSKDKLFDKVGLIRLKDSYMTADEQSPQERFSNVCLAMGSSLEHSQRLYRYVSNHWLSLSTPILSYGKTKKGLPISCYLSYIDDTKEGLIESLAEINQLSMIGGGIGIGVGIRSADEKSTGVMPHLHVYDACSLAYKQDGVRRGSYAAYLNIDHPEIIQFLDMRKPTGDHNMRCLNLHHGINITDKFMTIIENSIKNKADDAWELIDPHTKVIKQTISAKSLWQRILETRLRTGEPYICFIDTCNAALPTYQKDLQLTIKQSNLCSEIILPTDKDRTAVCCLSSLNLTYYDAWKDDGQFILDVAEMLDNALTLFINHANGIPYLNKAVYSAINERSIGIGVLGFHDYLQQKMVPFESEAAAKINVDIFKHIHKYVQDANFKLAIQRGETPDCASAGKRFSNTIAIAPTATSSIIMGNTSPGIEPYRANVYRQDTISGSHITFNKNLAPSLKMRNTLAMNNGSIQNMDEFTELQKKVFKTAFEIDQSWIIRHAKDRQPYIDQSQSLNLFLDPTCNVSLLHSLHFNAWKGGLKTLYYIRSNKIATPDKLSCVVCES